MKKIFSIFFLALVIAALGIGTFFGYRLFEGEPPVIKPEKIPPILGKHGHIQVKVEDATAGIRYVELQIQQGQKKLVLAKESVPMPSRWTGSPQKEALYSWNIDPQKLGLTSGKAQIIISAFDAALRNHGRGNEAILRIPIKIDYLPPIITVLSTIHNVRVGGAGAISFRVNEAVKRAGIKVDNLFFKAYRGSDGIYRALFAIPYNMHPKSLVVEATDVADNTGISGFAYRILPRRKRTDRINISDAFLRAKMPGFQSRYPQVQAPTLIGVFLKVNHILRKHDNEFLLSLCKDTQGEVLWSGAFERFKGARRSSFADERHYFYHGKEVDQAVHLGVDIASISHAKVPAANNGRVVFADFNGIYGNTVVIDHGMGLMSLYAHLSQINVTKGQEVTKGQTIGVTDSTGLAGGDHLHFGMMLGGVFVNPVEWWDYRWIRDHITTNLSLKD